VESPLEMAQHGLVVCCAYASRNGLVDSGESGTAFRPLDGVGKLLEDKCMDPVVYGALVRDLLLQLCWDRGPLPVRSKRHLRCFVLDDGVIGAVWREELDDHGRRFDDDKHRCNEPKGDGGGGLLLEQIVEDLEAGEETVRFV